ncbi:hypothetical protein AYI69_g4227 [Smittium culicis]|uniref:Uncharacterized protein n=1 Tax=Smittium culicis TaxID=133412 RepID=A0A1R1YFB9_9FUNG|nr:hypothetical protein AYI69_g4227 [Smittium culicis]
MQDLSDNKKIIKSIKLYDSKLIREQFKTKIKIVKRKVSPDLQVELKAENQNDNKKQLHNEIPKTKRIRILAGPKKKNYLFTPSKTDSDHNIEVSTRDFEKNIKDKVLILEKKEFKLPDSTPIPGNTTPIVKKSSDILAQFNQLKEKEKKLFNRQRDSEFLPQQKLSADDQRRLEGVNLEQENYNKSIINKIKDGFKNGSSKSINLSGQAADMYNLEIFLKSKLGNKIPWLEVEKNNLIFNYLKPSLDPLILRNYNIQKQCNTIHQIKKDSEIVSSPKEPSQKLIDTIPSKINSAPDQSKSSSVFPESHKVDIRAESFQAPDSNNNLTRVPEESKMYNIGDTNYSSSNVIKISDLEYLTAGSSNPRNSITKIESNVFETSNPKSITRENQMLNVIETGNNNKGYLEKNFKDSSYSLAASESYNSDCKKPHNLLDLGRKGVNAKYNKDIPNSNPNLKSAGTESNIEKYHVEASSRHYFFSKKHNLTECKNLDSGSKGLEASDIEDGELFE